MSNSFTDKFKAKHPPTKDTVLPDSSIGKSADASSVDDFIGGAKKDGRFICKTASHFLPDPNQPRKNFNADELKKLQLDIEEIGQLQPIMVRPEKEGKHEIIVGERRWRAISNSNDTKKIDAVILDEEVDELRILRMQIQENDNRVGVSILEEAAALVRGVDLNKKLDRNADEKSTGKMLGVSSSKISKSRAILNAPEVITSLSIDNIVNDYGSLYDLARVYKKHSDQITELVAKIRAGEITNIRSSVKNISGNTLRDRNSDSNNNAAIQSDQGTSDDKGMGNQNVLEAEGCNDAEQPNHEVGDPYNVTDNSRIEKDDGLPEPARGSRPASEPISPKPLQSGHHIDDIDFVDKKEGTVMKIFSGSEEYEFTLTEDAIETLTFFSR